jgi:hypothetical protein
MCLSNKFSCHIGKFFIVCHKNFSQITRMNTDLFSVKICDICETHMRSTYFAIAHSYSADQFLPPALISSLPCKMSNRFYIQYASFVSLFHQWEFDPVSTQQFFLLPLHKLIVHCRQLKFEFERSFSLQSKISPCSTTSWDNHATTMNNYRLFYKFVIA